MIVTNLRYALSVVQCPWHKYLAITLEDKESGHGTRLTRNKCCGSWNEVASWPMSAKDLEDVANELMEAAVVAKDLAEDGG